MADGLEAHYEFKNFMILIVALARTAMNATSLDTLLWMRKPVLRIHRFIPMSQSTDALIPRCPHFPITRSPDHQINRSQNWSPDDLTASANPLK
jgi:hypothetical protein